MLPNPTILRPYDRMRTPAPVPLGLKKSFGFGDRLGLAGPGHIAALRNSSFAGILAQQSIRELNRTDRKPEDVMEAARTAIQASHYDQPWGADADHLKNEDDVARTVEAGFCFFTIDPSTYVQNDADWMKEADLDRAIQAMTSDRVLPGSDWMDLYLGKDYTVGEDLVLRYNEESLKRAAVKYARAIAHCETMAGFVAKHCAQRPYELEVSVDETDSPTSSLEHLFFALELRRRSVTVVSLAPRFIGDFEKGVDYRGDWDLFEVRLREHVAIAREMGPYKISVHSGSDKFSVYPIIGRICGDLLHVKTAGTSYLEALRVVCQTDRELFQEIAAYCVGRFDEDVASYHVSTNAEHIAQLRQRHLGDEELEEAYLNEDTGRQLLHVTFGSVLTQGARKNGQPFKQAILELLEKEDDLHTELLESWLGRHLELLEAG
ncbi:MAG: tagaturonate epimerase family protein [Opitutales bacterium]